MLQEERAFFDQSPRQRHSFYQPVDLQTPGNPRIRMKGFPHWMQVGPPHPAGVDP